MEFKKTQYSGGLDPIWRGEARMFPGGFMPEDTLPAGCVVPRGVPVEVDFTNFTCKIGKSAKVTSGAGTTEAQVAKGHLFVAGDAVTDGTTTANVTAVDSTKEGYDTLTLDTALAGEVIYKDITPNGVTGSVYENTGLGVVTLDVAYNACVLYEALAGPVADAWRDGICMKGNPEIKFIRQ